MKQLNTRTRSALTLGISQLLLSFQAFMVQNMTMVKTDMSCVRSKGIAGSTSAAVQSRLQVPKIHWL